MRDIRDNGFEEEFRKAFEEAGQAPDQAVWAKLDAHLANQEAAKYKRRLFYFKIRVAAVALLVSGFLGVWLLNNPSQTETAPVALSPVTNGVHSPDVRSPNQGTEPKPDEQPSLNAETGVQAEVITKESTGSQSPGADASRRAPANLPDAEERITGGKRAKNPRGNQPRQPDTESNTEPIAGNRDTGLAKRTIADQREAATRNTDQTVLKNAELAVHPAETDLGKLINPPAETNHTDGFSRNGRSFDRLTQSVAISQEPRSLVRTLAPPQVSAPWEEEADYTQATASRWSVGLNFTPSQFNPNINVANNAATKLTGGSPFASNSNFATATGVAQDDNALNQQRTLRTSDLGNDLANARTLGISYNIGVDVGYALSEKFSLQSGVQYLYNNSQVTTDNYLEEFMSREKYPAFVSLISDEPVVAENVPLSSVGTGRVVSSYRTGVTEVAVYNTYQYLSVPVRLQYKIAGNKLSTSVGAGLAADIFLRNSIGNSAENVNTINFDGAGSSVYRAVGLSGLLSARLNYKVASRYNFFLEPGYRLALTPFTRSSLVKSKPDSFGIGTGIQYRF